MATAGLLLAVDVGTTGARAVCVDLNGEPVGETRVPYATTTPRPGWAEQDPQAWRAAALGAVGELTARPDIPAERIAAIGLTGQCPTIAPFDSRRRPLGPGLLYRDNRAVAQAARMRETIGEAAMHHRTGHVATAFQVGPKVLWLRDHQPDVFAAVDVFLQPRDVVLHALTGVTATDETHANSTVFFDLRQRAWADDLLDALDLTAEVFPTVVAPWEPVSAVSDEAARLTGLTPGCPVVIGAADSQCAAYGSDVRGPGAISEMAGASSCLNSVVLAPSQDRRITHYSHLVPDVFSTELGLNVSGAALSWAVSRLGFAGFGELEARAARVLERLSAGRGGDARAAAPLFLPYLGDGERDDPALRAGFVGVSDRHDRDELAYAAVEGVAFAVAETVSVLVQAGSPLEELRVAGGGGRLDSLGQIKAAALGRPVRHLAHDSAAVGVALLAASSCGLADEAEHALAENLRRATRFEPPSGDQAEAIAQRYRWFLEVRDSEAVRLTP